MRFMVIIKANQASEQGAMPSVELLDAMGKFNEELVKAGVMLGGEGLHPSSKGARVRFGKGAPKVIDGPFSETKELVAGFWLLQLKSLAECIEWVKRIPQDPKNPGQEGEVEIRQVHETEEFDQSSEAIRKEPALRAEVERQNAARK